MRRFLVVLIACAGPDVAPPAVPLIQARPDAVGPRLVRELARAESTEPVTGTDTPQGFPRAKDSRRTPPLTPRSIPCPRSPT